MKAWKIVILTVLVLLLGGGYSYGEWPRAIYDTDLGTGTYEDTGALKEDIVYEQRFTCYDPGLSGLSVKLSKLEHPAIGEYAWEVRDAETGDVVGEGTIDESTTENKLFESSSALKRGTVRLDIPRQKDSSGKEYIFTIKGKSVSDSETMAVYITEKNENSSSLSVGNKSLDKVGVIKLYYHRFNVETFIVFLGIMAYLVVFIKFMYRLFR